jgi:hypothetical protein
MHLPGMCLEGGDIAVATSRRNPGIGSYSWLEFAALFWPKRIIASKSPRLIILFKEQANKPTIENHTIKSFTENTEELTIAVVVNDHFTGSIGV